MTTLHYLCSYRPLAASATGREAIRAHGLPPFIDGSCRREPDFQASAPSISALCRGSKFARRLWPGDRVAYLSGQGRYAGDIGWCLVALLTVERRFESHEAAANWYAAQGYDLPSNCMVPGNAPQTYDRTNRQPPAKVQACIKAEADPSRAVRLWDATYASRARNSGVFLACRADFLELWRPPVLRRADILSVFGRIPGTQNPPKITPDEFERLAEYAVRSAMHELAREVWDLYNKAESQTYMVRPSIPILFFGDSETYKHSERRIVTVGLNPSRLEFPAGGSFVRFPAAARLQGSARSAAFYDRYLEALNQYFHSDPYSAWFDTFEPLLAGFQCSFYPGSQNTALHTDLCSPLATDPTWSNLSNEQRARLEQSGVTLWHQLITHLQPQVILISVAAQHLSKIQFEPLSDWHTICKLERDNPYELRHRLVRLDSGGQAHLIFGQAAQKPFGAVSKADKFNIGQFLANHLPEAVPFTA